MPPGAPPEQRPAEPGIPTPGRRDWVPALTGAAIVIALGVVAVLLFGGDRSTPLETDPDQDRINQAIAAAEEFIEAHNAYDAERARVVLVEDVRITSSVLGYTGNPEPLEGLMEFQAIAGFEYSLYQCELRLRPAEIRPSSFLWVFCDYEMDSRFQQIVGHPRVEGALQFGVVGGLITSIDDTFPDEEWSRHVDRPFQNWVYGGYPPGLDWGSTYVFTHGTAYHESYEPLDEVLDEFEAFIRGREEAP